MATRHTDNYWLEMIARDLGYTAPGRRTDNFWYEYIAAQLV